MNSFFAHVNSVSSALSGPQWLTCEQSLPVAPQGSLARDSSSVWTSHSCYLIWWVQEDGSPEAMPLLCALACILGPPGGPLVAGWPSMGAPPGFPWPARPTRPPLQPPEHHLSPMPGQTIQPVFLPSRPRLPKVFPESLNLVKYNLKHTKIAICINPRKTVLSKRNDALKLFQNNKINSHLTSSI